jgi:hypothetical protein
MNKLKPLYLVVLFMDLFIFLYSLLCFFMSDVWYSMLYFSCVMVLCSVTTYLITKPLWSDNKK